MKYFLSAVLLLFVSTTLFSQPVKNFQPDRPDYKLKGNVAKIEVKTIIDGQELETITTIFNDFGYPLCEFNKNDTICVYSYDKMGNLKVRNYNKPYKLLVNYEVDKDNNMIIKGYNGYNYCSEYEWIGNKLARKGKTDESYYIFNNNGLLIKENQFHKKSMIYNNKKLLVKENFYDGEKIFNVITYYYNNNDDPITIVDQVIDKSPTIRNIKYAYDKKGNWISKEETQEGFSYKKIETRKITYKEDLPVTE